MRLVIFGVYVAVAIMLVLNLSERGETETLIAGVAGVAVCGSMIFLSRVWADTILPFGFWEHFASDAGSSGNSAPAIVFVGWVLLALMGYGILVR